MSQLNAQFNAAQPAGGAPQITAPTLTPVDRQTTSITVQTSVYSGPGTHAKTQVQGRLATDPDWLTPVYDVTRTEGDLRTFQATGLIASTDYEFRALHGSSNGNDSDFGPTLAARTKGALTEFRQTNLLALYETPISGETDADPVDTWPETGPNGDTGPSASGTLRPTYRVDGTCTGLDVVEFDGTNDNLEDTVAGPSQTPNRIRDEIGTGNWTTIVSARHDGDGLATNNGTIWSTHDFAALTNLLVLQLLQNPDRFRVLTPDLDLILSYTPAASNDLDVFAVTYNATTDTVKVWHGNTLLGQGTSVISFTTTHWFEIGQERDGSGQSEYLEGVQALIAIWKEEMSAGELEDNIDFALDSFTCAGSPGGGGGGCSVPVVTFAKNVISAGGPRVDILTLGTPPANHTQSRWRLKLDSDDSIVYPSDGSSWVTSSIDLLGHTASDPNIPVGVLLYAEAEWFDGTAMTWCGAGESLRFPIDTRLPRSDRRRAQYMVYEPASPK